MVLPRLWWLLTLAGLGQGAFFVRWALVRYAGREADPTAGWPCIALLVGAAAGLAYGILQRDPVLITGEAVVLALGLHQRLARKRETR